MFMLAADTTTSILTVAVCNDARILAETTVDCGRAHSERLLTTVEWMLAETGLALTDMDALAVSTGPGSFTGLRVGLSAWKGLALANHLPLVSVPTLDAMTHLSAFQTGIVCPLLDARMSEIFGAIYSFEKGRRQKRTPDCVCKVEDLMQQIEQPPIVFGNGAALYAERIKAVHPEAVFLEPLCSVPRASAVAAEAMSLLEQGVDTDPAQAVPIYLRQSQAEINRRKKAGLS